MITNPDPQAVWLGVEETVAVRIVDDPYSDRVRCDHPEVDDGRLLGAALIAAAEARERGRVVVLARDHLAEGLQQVGMRREATMPDFYDGVEDCAVMGFAVDEARAALANPIEVGRVKDLIGTPPRRRHPPTPTVRAQPEDAPQIAALLDKTFADYPTPSHDPDYVADQIRGGTPFRMVHDGNELVACASADLVREARTAELTDCATRPTARGRGLMQSILTDLMHDLRRLGYPTAFTLARARIPGVNLAFERLGFALRGTMRQSCRIGEGIEDMNVWSRAL